MKHKVTIELDDETGEMHVDGPWKDGVLFLGMLEMGKMAFHESRSQVPDKQTHFVHQTPVGRPS